MNVLDKLQVIFDDHNEGVEDGHSSMDSVFGLYGELCALETAKNAAYSERNKLVATLSKLFPSALSRHPEEDTSWERDWMWIVFIDLPTGQITFHIHDSELGMFDHLPREQRVWDGHTTEEKYERLAALKSQ